MFGRASTAGLLAGMLAAAYALSPNSVNGDGARFLTELRSLPGDIVSPTGSIPVPVSVAAFLSRLGGECEYLCRPCGEEDEKHDIVEGHSQNNAASTHLENCNPETCEESGHLCGAPPEGGFAFGDPVLQEVWDYLSTSRGAAAARASIATVQYNADRAAIQVYGCDDQVIMSIPVLAD